VSSSPRRESSGPGWDVFHFNLMAFIYHKFFRRTVARDAPLPPPAARRLRAVLAGKAPGAGLARVQHTFEPPPPPPRIG
jgi:hypothetical protein